MSDTRIGIDRLQQLITRGPFNQWLGFRIVAVPVRLGFADGRATSHYRPLVDSLRIGRGVIRARLESIW